MNKPLTTEELAKLQVPFAAEPAQPMTRRARIGRWAALLRAYQGDVWVQPNEMEHRLSTDAITCTAYEIAANDPVLAAQGLTGATQGEIKKFFDVTDYGLHIVLCQCGGHYSAGDVSARLDYYSSYPQIMWKNHGA